MPLQSSRAASVPGPDRYRLQLRLTDKQTGSFHPADRHMAKGSNDLLPDLPGEKNPFAYQLTEAEADNDQESGGNYSV
jgi:uncharacterized membrane-anchored protein YhcB (DUF1043 family)